MERFKRNFKNYLLYDPNLAMKRKLDEIRRGRFDAQDNLESPTRKSLSPSKM